MAKDEKAKKAKAEKKTNKKRGNGLGGWLSIRGVVSEAKRIRWSKPKDLASDSGEVILFTAIFVLFFVLCTFFNAWFLNLLGIGA